MKLYGHPLSSCTRKVLFVLAEKGAAADLIVVDLLAGEHRRPEHLARHPFGRIPVLDDGGFVLYESRAIIRYLDQRLGGTPLVPSDPRARARMEQWLDVDHSYVSPAVRTLVRERVVAPGLGRPADPAAVAGALAELDQALAAIDAGLGEAAHLAGPALSLADVSLAPYVAALPHLGAGELLAARPRLAAWWQRIAARPAWRTVEAARAA